MLTQITNEAPDAFPAWLRLAEIAFAQGKLDEAQTAVDAVLKTSADNASALIIQTRHPPREARGGEGRRGRPEGGEGAAGERPRVPHAGAGAGRGRQQRARAGRGARTPWRARRCWPTPSFLLAELQLQAGDTVGRRHGLKAYLERAAEGRPRLGGARQGAAALAETGRGAGLVHEDSRAAARQPARALPRGPRAARAGQGGRGASSSSRRRSRWRPASRSRSTSSPR